MMRASSLRRLSPLFLLAVALVALAVFVVHDSPPAAADHDAATTVWSATLSIGAQNEGCGITLNCSTQLTSTTFTYAGVTYTINRLRVTPSGLELTLTSALQASIKTSAAVFNVDGTEFRFADGSYSNSDTTVFWSRTGLSWTAGDTVELSLSSAAPPSGVELSTETLAVNEGASGTFTVALTDDPGASGVTVTLTRTQYFQSDYGESDHRWNLNAATVSPATLTFTSSNYTDAQNVTVTGVQDDDTCDEQLVILVLGVDGGSITGVLVTVDDDDTGQGCGGI